MDSPRGIAARLRAAMHGPMWHGPGMLEAIGTLSADQAAAYPIQGAHSVWELVLHIAAWAEIARARLDGSAPPEPLPHEDWPPVDTHGGAKAWRRDRDRAVAAYEALADDVAALSPEALGLPVAGHPYKRAVMLHGVVEHGVYHAGQIILLRRAIQTR